MKIVYVVNFYEIIKENESHVGTELYSSLEKTENRLNKIGYKKIYKGHYESYFDHISGEALYARVIEERVE